MRLRQHLLQLWLPGLLIGLISCGGSAPLSPEPEQLPALSFTSELQAALDQALEKGQGTHDLGISAAVSVPGYRTWVGVSGNSQPGEPITPEMRFDAGSVAKNFEAALALKLAEAGRLDLDEPHSRWLPAYPHVDPAITVRQLLNHTSGIFNVFEHPDFPWVGPGVDYSRDWDIDEVFGNFVLEPYFPAGSGQHYSSTNYLLLTALLEEEIGAPVQDEIRRTLLRPLDLEHTWITMGAPPPAEIPVAHPWTDVDLDGTLEDLHGIPLNWKATMTHPVIFTTPRDLTRWMRALYHERVVLPPAWLAEMTTFPQLAVYDPEGGRYGLGVVDYTQVLGKPVIGHGGSSLGYSAAALYLPEYGVALAWMVNTGESPAALAGGIMGETWTALSGVLDRHLTPQPHPESEATPSPLAGP